MLETLTPLQPPPPRPPPIRNPPQTNLLSPPTSNHTTLSITPSRSSASFNAPRPSLKWFHHSKCSGTSTSAPISLNKRAASAPSSVICSGPVGRGAVAFPMFRRATEMSRRKKEVSVDKRGKGGRRGGEGGKGGKGKAYGSARASWPVQGGRWCRPKSKSRWVCHRWCRTTRP